jgi:serine/threonine-protein kinase
VRARRDIDARSDVWAMGVLLYQMLTSQLPFRAPGRVGVLPIMSAITESTPIAPSELVPAIPPALEAAILRCLEKERERRFQNVGELAVALAPFAPVDAMLLVTRIRRVLGAPRAMPAGAAALQAISISEIPPCLQAGEPVSLELVGGDATVRSGAPESGELSPALNAPSTLPPLLQVPGALALARQVSSALAPQRHGIGALAQELQGPATLTSAAWDHNKLCLPTPPPSRSGRPRGGIAAAAAIAALAVLGGVGFGAQRGASASGSALAAPVAGTGVATAAAAAAEPARSLVRSAARR